MKNSMRTLLRVSSVSQAVKCLLCEHEILSSNYSATKGKKGKKEKLS
jgi:hypothetical protein